MSSRRLLIRNALIDALEAATAGGMTKPRGVTVHAMRTRPLEHEHLPALVVYTAREHPELHASGASERTAEFWVEARAKLNGDDPDTALDPLLVWIVKAILVDQTLGQLVSLTEEGDTVFDLELKDGGYAAAAIKITSQHSTSDKDPEVTG